MSYEDNFLFLWCPTRHIFTMGSFERGGRKEVRSLSFGWLSSIKNWWKTHTVTTCLNWKQISAPLSAPLFRNISDLKRYVNRIPLTRNAHFIDTHRLVTIKMKLHGSLRKNEKMKIEKIEITKNCNVFLFQTKCCKIRTRWAMRIIFYSCDAPSFIFSFRDHLKRGGGGKGCAYLLSAQTSRYSVRFS